MSPEVQAILIIGYLVAGYLAIVLFVRYETKRDANQGIDTKDKSYRREQYPASWLLTMNIIWLPMAIVAAVLNGFIWIVDNRDKFNIFSIPKLIRKMYGV